MLIIQRPTVEAVGEEEDNRQRFAVGPLDPGFGHTLGQLPAPHPALVHPRGGSITQVRFDEALHEFTTLPGVKEDVTDLILNLKDLLFRVHSDEPVTIRLDKRGPGDATAGDLQVTADVEVLNPAQHIASLNAKGRLAVDLTVERGRGYLSADKSKRSATIGVIPVDAIFSPVRRVAFTVEPVRVEQSTDFDRLVLDIETDGSLTPREALASAGDTLRTLVGLVADLEDEPMGLELGEVGTIGTGLARPRPAHRGPRPHRAPPQLPQAGPDQHHRRAGRPHARRPAQHHQLRAEVARRGAPEARRAGTVPAGQGLRRRPCSALRRRAGGSAGAPPTRRP